MMVIIIKVMCR